MNAKEISDATLPTVTPADDDLMLIYDTSEGTTGKATIADIIPTYSKKEYIITDVNSTDLADVSFIEFSLESYGLLRIINARIKVVLKQNLSMLKDFISPEVPAEIKPMLVNVFSTGNLFCVMSFASYTDFIYEIVLNSSSAPSELNSKFTIRTCTELLSGTELLFSVRVPLFYVPKFAELQ